MPDRREYEGMGVDPASAEVAAYWDAKNARDNAGYERDRLKNLSSGGGSNVLEDFFAHAWGIDTLDDWRSNVIDLLTEEVLHVLGAIFALASVYLFHTSNPSTLMEMVTLKAELSDWMTLAFVMGVSYFAGYWFLIVLTNVVTIALYLVLLVFRWAVILGVIAGLLYLLSLYAELGYWPFTG